MNILFWVCLAFLFLVFPLISCLLFHKHDFRGGKIGIFILLYSCLSWGVTNGFVYLNYLLSPENFRGPEGAFALFFGWLYLWITSIPVFFVYVTTRIIWRLLKKKKRPAVVNAFNR